MTVDYQLEPADFLVIAEEQRRFVPHSLARLYYFGVLPALGAGLALATQSFSTAAVFTALFMACAWLVQDRWQKSYRSALYSEQNLSFNRRRWNATLSDEGIRISSDAADILYRWAFIREVFRGSRFVHIELTPLYKLHIPVRAFRDEEHVQNFVSQAQSHIKNPVP
jgi:hypothetical protein